MKKAAHITVVTWASGHWDSNTACLLKERSRRLPCSPTADMRSKGYPQLQLPSGFNLSLGSSSSLLLITSIICFCSHYLTTRSTFLQDFNSLWQHLGLILPGTNPQLPLRTLQRIKRKRCESTNGIFSFSLEREASGIILWGRKKLSSTLLGSFSWSINQIDMRQSNKRKLPSLLT